MTERSISLQIVHLNVYLIYMDYITTTDLRTKSSKLIDTLKKGKSVKLIHRSRVVAKIEPMQQYDPPLFDSEKFKKTLAKMPDFPVLSLKERERRYRKHLEEKYGKGIS